LNHLLLPLVQPTCHRNHEKRKRIQTRLHPWRLSLMVGFPGGTTRSNFRTLRRNICCNRTRCFIVSSRATVRMRKRTTIQCGSS
jgi:hypothetical protein